MRPIFHFKATFVLLLFLLFKLVATSDDFHFNGFSGANLTLDGTASITSSGSLELTNFTMQMKGHAFHPKPLNFKTSPNATAVKSFFTTFVFVIVSELVDLSGHGMTFQLSPSKDFSHSLPSQYLGLFNSITNGNASNHVLAVELDTIQSNEFYDIDDNHVGININSLVSNASHTAGYYNATGEFQNLTLISGKPIQVWIDYDGVSMQFNVTLGPVDMHMPKPQSPLLSSTIDLSSIIFDQMYVGFSSSTGSINASHYVLGWSFKMDGEAEPLDLSGLPGFSMTSGRSKVLPITLPLASAVFLLLASGTIIFVVRRREKFAELVEDWEQEYGPHRFSYKDLFVATKGFKEKELLGVGGFGRVYKGVLPTSKLEVAVKRVSHESRQGTREFVAEIVSIGRLRHRNIVQFLGYCRRKGELLLVYDYMPNGSLDKFLFDTIKAPLDWTQRFRIIKGVASGLLYLHEDWNQVVIHRDIKASNVLLDTEMNAKLGDFGLARLYDHGTDPQTTHVVGTMGYIAPELARTGKATPLTDVFAFGAFVLEVVCGRRPVNPRMHGEEPVLVDWVLDNWRKGAILDSKDPRLGNEFVDSELELVLRVGLLCSYPLPMVRPSMKQVLQYLDRDIPLPELPPTFFLALIQNDDFACVDLHPSQPITASVLSAGR